MQPHRPTALDGAAAALTVARTCVVRPCYCHGLGLISLRAARERMYPRSAILSTRPRSGPYAIALQRRFGLCTESARGGNDALVAAGKTPDWLGDAACNEGEHSTRHHAVNRAWHAALTD